MSTGLQSKYGHKLFFTRVRLDCCVGFNFFYSHPRNLLFGANNVPMGSEQMISVLNSLTCEYYSASPLVVGGGDENGMNHGNPLMPRCSEISDRF